MYNEGVNTEEEGRAACSRPRPWHRRNRSHATPRVPGLLVTDRRKLTRTKHPGIYKRGDRYVVVWQHKGKQHKSMHRTQKEALEAQGRVRQPGQSKRPTRDTFEAYALRWIDGYAGRTARGFSASTRDGYRDALTRHAIPFFARYRLAEIEPADVRGFVRRLENRGLAPASVRRYVAPLRAMFAQAVEDGDLRSNPASGVRVAGKSRESLQRALTETELGLLLAAIPDDSPSRWPGGWRLPFRLLAETGLRIGELIALEWRDLDLGARPSLRVREGKTESAARTVPLAPETAGALLTLRARAYRGDDHAPVFATTRGTRLDDHNVRRALRRYAKPIGLGWIGPHTLRHTCASLLLQQGRSVRQVAAWLGHADRGALLLRTYAHLLDEGVGAPLDLFGARPGQHGTPKQPETTDPSHSTETAQEQQK